jgi:hypothetical protein
MLQGCGSACGSWTSTAALRAPAAGWRPPRTCAPLCTRCSRSCGRAGWRLCSRFLVAVRGALGALLADMLAVVCVGQNLLSMFRFDSTFLQAQSYDKKLQLTHVRHAVSVPTTCELSQSCTLYRGVQKQIGRCRRQPDRRRRPTPMRCRTCAACCASPTPAASPSWAAPRCRR